MQNRDTSVIHYETIKYKVEVFNIFLTNQLKGDYFLSIVVETIYYGLSI